MAEILPDRESSLRQLLESARQDPANNSLVPFGRFPNVHFARFFIWPATIDPLQGMHYTARLFFLADVDGPANAFLVALCNVAADGLDAIFAECRGYPGPSGLLNFLRQHAIP